MPIFLAMLAGLSVVAYLVGRARAVAFPAEKGINVHSLPAYHGMFLGLLALLFGLAAYAAVRAAGLPYGDYLALAVAVLAVAAGVPRLQPRFRARNLVERIITVILAACSASAILTTIGIVFAVLFEALRFFAEISPFDFLFGLNLCRQLLR